MKDKIVFGGLVISIVCLYFIDIINGGERTKLEKRVDFLETQWKCQEFYRTNVVWTTNYMTVLIERIDK